MRQYLQRFMLLAALTLLVGLAIYSLAVRTPSSPVAALPVNVEGVSSPNPESDALVQIGERYFLEGRYDKAAEAYASAATKDPGNQLAFDRLRLALQAQNYIPTVWGYVRNDWNGN